MFAKFLTSGFVLFLIFLSFISYQNAEAQVFQDWVMVYNGVCNIGSANSVDTDLLGNVFVNGTRYCSDGGTDIITIKYNPYGNEEWVRIYNGPGNAYDYSKSMALDITGNIYITGISQGLSGDYDFATIKYDSNGNTIWVSRFNGEGNYNDISSSIAIDDNGNVYVTGTSFGLNGSYNFTTIKYDNGGDILWIRYNSSSDNLESNAVSIAIDNFKNIYVTGYSNTYSTWADYTTIKYNNNGDEIWVRNYNYSSNSGDFPTSIVVDYAGNVYVTGFSYGIVRDFATLKYNTSGDLLWINRYNGNGNSFDEANTMAVDNQGNVYVAGYSTIVNQHFTTIKYNSDGYMNWVKVEYGVTGKVWSITVDDKDNTYITGDGFITIKYNSNGDKEWQQSYSSQVGCSRSINVDLSGSVYIAGESNLKFTTIKYSQIQDPAEMTVLLVNTIDSMQTEGILSEGNANSLRTKLNDAIKKINEGQFNTAINNLNAFTNEVQALINSGRLTPLQGNALIDRANAIIEQLSGDRSPTLTEEPKEYKLHNNYPNPFNPVTSIRYDITETSDVKLVVYNTLGQEIDVLINKTQKAGSYIVEWHASNYPSGVYFYKLTAGKFTDIKKMVLLK